MVVPGTWYLRGGGRSLSRHGTDTVGEGHRRRGRIKRIAASAGGMLESRGDINERVNNNERDMNSA